MALTASKIGENRAAENLYAPAMHGRSVFGGSIISERWAVRDTITGLRSVRAAAVGATEKEVVADYLNEP